MTEYRTRLIVYANYKEGVQQVKLTPSHPLRSCITRANFRLAKLEKAEFTRRK